MPETQAAKPAISEIRGDRGQIFRMVMRSLTDANPGYRDVDEIVRFFADGAPLHIAAHWIEGAPHYPARDYSCVHEHEDFVEINVLLGEPGGLTYSVVLGDAEPPTLIQAPAAIVVPPGVPHSANVVSGQGWFVVLRLPIT
jgi:hypothetical protein